jgi:NAD(P)-dependent dehydrogenase (short-subunit alcohol dehydrogenase family)
LSFGLEGKIALVTGASRGLGRAIVLALARAGADVVVTSRKLDACREVAAEVEAETGRRAFAYPCHMGRWHEVEDLVVAAYERFGKVDVLVNNAGMSPLYERLDLVSEDLWDKVMAVNLKGPFRLSALVASRMNEGDGGSIVNISSIAAIMPNPTETPYGAAKAGLNALTAGFAQAYAPKVRVNCILPGPLQTDASNGWDMERFKRVLEIKYAMHRMGDPEEIVGAVLYFASSLSSFTTGALLRIDGGRQ